MKIWRSSTVFLYGPPGAGKSTLGRRLADQLGIPFWDLDHEIEARTRRKIPQLFQSRGEAGFRKIEQRVLQGFLTNDEKVISLGGGSLLDTKTRSQVQDHGRVLVLQASMQTIQARLSQDALERPLLAGDISQRLQSLLERRKDHYASFPMQLSVDNLSLDELIWRAQITLGMHRLRGMGKAYDVRVVNGGLHRIARALQARQIQGPIVVVTDEIVGELYERQVMESLEEAGYQVSLLHIPSGEGNKRLGSIERIWTAFADAHLERGSTAIALGGGVINDLVGFAAATFLRGIQWVTIPTTLLAMIDASLGGKTGADISHGKNLIGAFYPPRLVFVDPSLLTTLPQEEFLSGMAEVVKHGIIADPELFQMCKDRRILTSPDGWEDLVCRAMAVKIKVIEEDPYELGKRAALNLGHTIGHGVEAASGYTLRHGEAVAIGIACATRLSARMGIAQPGTDEIIRVLDHLGLPTRIPDRIDRSEIWNKMLLDKKRSGGLRFTLPVKVGEVKTGVTVPENMLREEGL